MPSFKRCRCNWPIYLSSQKSWKTGRCHECRKRESALDRQITQAEQRYNALLQISRRLGEFAQ